MNERTYCALVAAAVISVPTVASAYDNPLPYRESHERGLAALRQRDCFKALVIFLSEKDYSLSEAERWATDVADALECTGSYEEAVAFCQGFSEAYRRKYGHSFDGFGWKIPKLMALDLERDETSDEKEERKWKFERASADAEDRLRSEDKYRQRADAERVAERRRNERLAAQRRQEAEKEEFDRSGTERILRDLLFYRIFHADAAFRAPAGGSFLDTGRKFYTFGGQLLWFGAYYVSDTGKNKPVSGKAAEESHGAQFTFAPLTVGTWLGAEKFERKPLRDVDAAFSPYLGYRLGGAWVGGAEAAVLSFGIRVSISAEYVWSGGGMPGGCNLGIGIGTGY